jgi:CRISPR-associated protein, cmr2 family
MMNLEETKNEAYTAITIGPIGKTLDKARSVKSFWTASYLFSWIMRNLLTELSEGGFEVLSPALVGKDVLGEISEKVGLYPDRLFAKGELKEKKLEEVKGKIFGDLAGNFKEAFQNEKKDIEQKIKKESNQKRKRELEEIESRYSNAASKGEEYIREYLKNYLSISCITVELDSDCGILEQLNNYLDTQELFKRASIQIDEDYMELFIEAPNNPFLKAYSTKRAFPSTSEIAVLGWEKEPPKDEKGEVEYSQLSSKPGFRNCYKYLAVIKADGDRFGTYIKTLKVDKEEEIEEDREKKNKLSRFTKSFSDFSVGVAKELKEPEAIPVYIGGDDLFLFTPVLGGNIEKDVFHLIKKIDDLFIQRKIGIGLSMSYGVSVFYYKSPMSEAIHIAESMLEKAKGATRDAVAISIQKHSGQKIECLLPRKHSTDEAKRKGCLYEKIILLIRDFKGDGNMLNSLIYWIEEMYEILFIDEVTQSQERINAVFDNFFDEEIHKKNKEFFDHLKDFIYSMHLSEDVPNKLSEKKLLHGILRYCQFVTAKTEK